MYMTVQEYISELKNKPYKTIERKYTVNTERRPYYITESFEYRDSFELIKGDIKCSISETEQICRFGDVETDIHLDFSKIIFGPLYVPEGIRRQGIGEQLMLATLDLVKAVKEYHGYGEKVCISGWLSSADKEKNWETSVPLYHKVGAMAGVEHFFKVDGRDEKYATPEEFLANAGAGNGGNIVYMI